MRISTLICAGVFLAFVLHGRYDFSAGGAHPRAVSHQLFHGAIEKAGSGERELREIDRRMGEARAVLARIERTERLLAERLAEIDAPAGAAGARRPGRTERRAAGREALLDQLQEVRAEKGALVASLESLKTERVRLQAQQEIRESSAKLRAIEGFLGAGVQDGRREGPLDGIAGDLEREARRAAATDEDLARRAAF